MLDDPGVANHLIESLDACAATPLGGDNFQNGWRTVSSEI